MRVQQLQIIVMERYLQMQIVQQSTLTTEVRVHCLLSIEFLYTLRIHVKQTTNVANGSQSGYYAVVHCMKKRQSRYHKL